jgi:hypothetical protein
MDLKIWMIISTLILIPATVFLKNENIHTNFMHTRGFGKKSLYLNKQDVPHISAKHRIIFWKLSKLLRNMGCAKFINKFPVKKEDQDGRLARHKLLKYMGCAKFLNMVPVKKEDQDGKEDQVKKEDQDGSLARHKLFYRIY